METGLTYLTATQVRLRYGGRSDMWLFRLLRNDPRFPKPMKISKQRYWNLAELLAWEEAHKSQAEVAA
jgi:predicted DNA-binding transcriptional regulator AlpA